jgi:hypothetical protein
MAATNTWRATALLPDNSERLLCEAGCFDYVCRWCRRVLNSWGGATRARVAAIIVSRYDGLHERGWRKERQFLPPFAELLTARRRRSLPPESAPPRPRPQQSDRVLGDAATVFLEPSQVLFSEADPQLTLGNNRLLTWLSAAGKGRWEEFLHVCRTLGVARDGREAERIIRGLVLLGHVERSEEGGKWSVVPPTVTPLADEPERYFLRGQRTPSLLGHLPLAREETSQPHGTGPARISLHPEHCDDATVLRVGDVSFRVERGGAVARAQAMPTWREWFDRTPPLHGLVLTKFDRKEKWDGTRWVEVSGTLFEEETHRIRGDTGMYRLSREHPFRSSVYVFFDATGQKFVRGDWYGLRFLARRFQRLPLTALWCVDRRLLSIPSAEHWPLVYEQVLVQASGLLPGRTSAGDLCYAHVPEPLARCLGQKLGIDLVLSDPERACPRLLAAR